MNSWRLFIKISLDRKHYRRQIDFEAAYLFSPLTEELYLETPEGWNCSPGKILKLAKSLYGLKQAGRYWHLMIRDFLLEQGFVMCLSEHCWFTKDNGDMMVLIYVDDAIISAKNADDINELIKKIKMVFELGEEGPLDWYIGVDIKDYGDSLFISQSDYITKMEVKYKLDSSRIEITPMIEKYAIIKSAEDELFHDFGIKEKIGSLMFTAVCVRPDIAFAVSYLARFSNHPSALVCRAINHLFGYLIGTKEFGLMFEREDDSQLIVFCDSDYGGDLNDYKSTTGVIAYYGLTPICWYSSKQGTTAQSSTDAEIISMNFAAKEVIWLRGLLKEVGAEQLLPTKLKGDSQSAILLARNPVFHKRTKHIMLKFMLLVECLENDTLIGEHIPGTTNPADTMTKSQKRPHFLISRDRLNMINKKLKTTHGNNATKKTLRSHQK